MTRKTNRIAWLQVLALVTLLFAASSAIAATVHVKVFESTDATGATYFYRVENGSGRPVVALRVGFDYLHGEPGLQTLPLGWTFEQGLPASSAGSPNGWTARVVTMEESALFDMEWSSDGDAQFDIAPGATMTGFSVRLPHASAEYRTAQFDVILGDSTHQYGALEPDPEGPPPPSDTTPPTLTVSLSPAVIWPPNHKMAAVTATIQVSDNADPNPVVRLVSITCNEPVDYSTAISGAAFGTDDRQFSVLAARSGQRKEGRVYTVTYSATDAAGNQATATATVSIPHDRRQ